MTLTQLRSYQLPSDEAERQQWLTWWADVRAMRERHGFRVVAATFNPDTGEFIWIVEHPDFVAAEQTMLASTDRADVFAQSHPPITILRTEFVDRIYPIVSN